MKKSSWAVIIVLIIIFSSSASLVKSLTKYEITGTISYKDSSPVSKAKVEIFDGDKSIKSVSTKGQGTYRISVDLNEEQEYIIKVTKPNTQSITETFTTTINTKINLSFTLNRLPVALMEGPKEAYLKTLISFSGKNSYDLDEDQIEYFWEFGDGETSSSVNPTHSFQEPGEYITTLTVQDDDGGSSTDSQKIVIKNRQPISNPNGPYSGRVGQSIQFNSDGSYDPDGDPINYYWEFGDGASSEASNPQHVYEKEGKYTVHLTVSDIFDLQDRQDTTCEIIQGSEIEAIINGPYKGTVDDEINFYSSGSYSTNGDIISYLWDFGDGVTSSLPNPSHKYTTSGIYKISLTIEDSLENLDTAITTCTVNNTSYEPIAECNGPYQGKPNVIIQFYSTGSNDPLSGLLEYIWYFGDGSTSIDENPSHIYSTEGTYLITLIVTNQDGMTDTDSSTCTVRNMSTDFQTVIQPNKPPKAIAYFNELGEVGESIDFSSHGSYDPDGEIISTAWDFGDTSTSSEENTSHIYVTSGIYTVVLTVIDNENSIGDFSKNITILKPNMPPNLEINGPYEGKSTKEITFSSEGSYDEDGKIVKYEWNFGDNKTSLERDPTHSYSSMGNYSVTLTVTDDRGGSQIATTYSLIKENIPPLAIINGPVLTKTGEMVNFSGIKSYDPDGTITGYQWNMGDRTLYDSENISHIYLRIGEYNVTLHVIDNDESFDEKQVKIEVKQNDPPDIKINETYSGIPNEKINFQFKVTDPDGKIAIILFDFGDGYQTTTNASMLSHVYELPGTYYGRISATDDSQQTSFTTFQIIIKDTNKPLKIPILTSSLIIVIIAYITISIKGVSILSFNIRWISIIRKYVNLLIKKPSI